MNHINTNAICPPVSRRFVGLRRMATGLAASVALGVVMLGVSAHAAADMFRPLVLTPGGVPAQSIVSLTSVTTTNVTVTGYGMQGWYDVELSTNLVNWVVAGHAYATVHSWSLTVSNTLGVTNVLQVRLNQNNAYVGSGGCSGCHGDKFSEWSATEHASAFNAITNEAAQASELVYRTVGNGQPTGFVNSSTNAHLENVGCENCHGPAAWHKYSDHDLIHPAVTIAAEVCGGCHSTADRPTYNEWTNSPHAAVVSDFASGISDTFAGQKNAVSCGPCHSGAARLAMLDDYENRLAGITNLLALPSAHDITNYAQTCAVCHDPHSAEIGYQLRNPLVSTNFFTYFTGSPTVVTARTNFAGVVTYTTNYVDDNFLSQYNPNIQICAQCHNTRGGRWDGIGRTWTGSNFVASTASWSRPPHPTAQYNMLIGVLQDDYLTGTNSPVTHRHTSAPYGCATCHVPIYSSGGTNITGHTFALDTHGCTTSGCHGSVPNYPSTQTSNSNNLYAVVRLLNQWATNAGPTLFGANYANYGSNAWEYTTPGSLGSTNYPGPSSSDQVKLPATIKQARFDLYEVLGDSSWGVHNPTYIPNLISDASTKVSSALIGTTNAAYFTASATTGYTPFSVSFTSWGIGITNYNWDFGDGGTSTSANPIYVYNNPGTNTVTLTVMTSSGTATYTRTNYIKTYVKPVISFTGGPLVGEAPMTVTFTNTSTSTNSVTQWRWTFGTINVTTNATVYTYTFTNHEYVTIALQATTPAGSLSVTSNAFVKATTNAAYFVSSATSGYAPLTNTFTYSGVGATNYNWSFGDGGTSTNANPTYVFNSRGTNTVSLTVRTAGGNNTYTRTNYVTTYDRPVVSFTANTLSGAAPLSVTFTNTSTSTNSVAQWRWTVNSQNVTNNTPTYTYIFTNVTPASYTVALRAYTPAGSVTTTSNAYITVTAP